ncbi:MAG: hypothetical protein PHW13_00525 [Methylococcales bacterium]|nr:hypothetical protein [Methylococcales bacterium]
MTALLELAKPSLLVIDNANKLNELTDYYLALRRCPNFHILLTSRITVFEHLPAYKIAALPASAAADLFKRFYPQHDAGEDGLLEQILAAVGYNTLVIKLLVKYLSKRNGLKVRYRLADLLHDLQQHGLLSLNHTEVGIDYHAPGMWPYAKPRRKRLLRRCTI